MNTGKTLGSYYKSDLGQNFQSGLSGSTISAQNVLFAAVTHLTQLYGLAINWDENICLPTVAAMGRFVVSTAPAIDNVIELSTSGQYMRAGQGQARAA